MQFLTTNTTSCVWRSGWRSLQRSPPFS